ncbi:MAG: SDR family oxidoreductase [Chloroflexota bacterium]
MNKAIVTGGAGFIGSHLAEGLVKRGYRVAILDDLSTGKMGNIEGLLSRKSADFVRGSVLDLALLMELFQDTQYVFHQAAIPSVPRSIENPMATHEANATGTLNVLFAAAQRKAKKVIYASSSSAYGDTPTLPKKEDMSPDPQSPYAVSKLAGEYYGQVFQKVYGLPSACLRYFNVYGPRQDPHSEYAAVIPKFIQRTLAGEPPVIFGDGEQTRDFTFVLDVVEANILAAESEAAGVFNIGRGERISINQLAGLIIKLTGSNVRPDHRKERPGEIKHSLADISRARGFGFEPKWGLEKGLRETIRRFQGEK